MTEDPHRQDEAPSQQDFPPAEQYIPQTEEPLPPPADDPVPLTEAGPAADPVFAEPARSEPLLGAPTQNEPLFSPEPQTAVAIFPDEVAPDTAPEGPTVAAPDPMPAEPPVAAAPAPQRLTSREIAEAFRSRDRVALAGVAERGSRILFAVAIFLVPVVFDPRTIDSFNLAKLTSLWTLGLLAAGAWWLSTHLDPRERSLPRTGIVRLSLIVLGITAVATLLSPNRMLSFVGLYHRYEGFISIAIYVGVVLLMVLLYRRHPAGLHDVATAVGAAGGIVGLYVIFQKMGVDVSEWRQATGTVPRFPIGNLGNSAFTASFLGIAAPFILYLVVAARGMSRRVVWLVAGGLVAIALWLTQGRSGMIGAVVGLAAVLLFVSRLTPVRKVAIVLVAFLALALTPVVFGDPSDPSFFGVFRTGTAGYRVQIWEASWKMFLNRPVLGWGPETFYGNYTRFRTPDEARRQGLAIADKPHNIYLGWATATGIAGLVAYLLLVGGAILVVARRASSFTRSRRLLSAAFAGGLVAYLAQGLYSVDVPPLALLGWVALGAIAVLADRKGGGVAGSEEPMTEAAAAEPPPPARADRRRSRPWDRRPWIVPALVGVLVLLLLYVGFAPLRADHAAWAAERRAILGWSADTMEMYEKAIDLNPREAAYRGLTANYLERIAGNPAAPFSRETALRRSADRYKEALKLQPRNVYFMINVARVFTKLGKDVDLKYFKRGERWIGQAVTLDPLNPQMHDLYTDLLNQWSKEVKGETKSEILRRANTQAAIAKALRAGQVVR